MISNTYQKTVYRGEENQNINKLYILRNTIEYLGILRNYVELHRNYFILL
jgi:hypothetical protein